MSKNNDELPSSVASKNATKKRRTKSAKVQNKLLDTPGGEAKKQESNEAEPLYVEQPTKEPFEGGSTLQDYYPHVFTPTQLATRLYDELEEITAVRAWLYDALHSQMMSETTYDTREHDLGLLTVFRWVAKRDEAVKDSVKQLLKKLNERSKPRELESPGPVYQWVTKDQIKNTLT